MKLPLSIDMLSGRRALAGLAAACAALLLASLSACAPLVIGGAVVGGMVATDRRTSGAQLEDQAIELKSLGRIHDAIGDRGHVEVTSFNRLTLITGTVPVEADRRAVEQAVSRIENVKSVVDELQVAFSPSLSTRSRDLVISSKVKASLFDARDLQVGAFKVVTESGVVYLMGIVTEREAQRAADIARGVADVVKVVKVFEIVSEDELARIRQTSAPVSK